MRIVTLARKTAETDIELTLNLDGVGSYEVGTGCGFLNHMLELFARHGRFGLKLICRGDTHVDDHHTVEDTAIVLGRAFSDALEIPTEKVGTFDTQLVHEFLLGFARSLGCAVHVRRLAGENSHHIIEGAFKALARALAEAVSIDAEHANEIPSTKGTIL